MNQDEILGTLRKVIAANQQFTTWTVSTPHIMELIRICVEHEREACAQLADEAIDFWVKAGHPECAEVREAQNIAEAIRARGEK